MPSYILSVSPRLRAAVMLLAVSACGGERAAPIALVDTLPGGIVRTISTAPADSGQWHLVLERSIQPLDGSPGAIGYAGSVALADDGTLYLADAGSTSIKVYAPDGSFVREMGRQGSGPGEFETGNIQLLLLGDTLAVQDPSASRLTLFPAAGGEPLAIIPTACCHYSRIGRDGAGRLLIPALSEASSTERFLRVNVVSGVRDTLDLPSRSAGEDAMWNYFDDQGDRRFMQTPPFVASTVGTADRAGSYVSGWTDSYQLAVIDAAGDTVALFGRTHTPEAISDAVRRAAVEQRVESNRKYWPEEGLRRAFDISKIPGTYPAFGRIDIDGDGRRWIRVPGSDTASVTLDLFDVDGRWLDQVNIPSAKWSKLGWEPSSWTGTHAAVVTNDEDDLPIIHVYRIERTKP